jgi:uncharacterized protein YodC (DUF2158 family)
MSKRKAFNIGDVVKLKSGGPEMTIERGGTMGGRLVFICTWIADGKVSCRPFYIEVLEHA